MPDYGVTNLDTKRNFGFSVAERERKNFSMTCVNALLILWYFVVLVNNMKMLGRTFVWYRLGKVGPDTPLGKHGFPEMFDLGLFFLFSHVQGVSFFIAAVWRAWPERFWFIAPFHTRGKSGAQKNASLLLWNSLKQMWPCFEIWWTQ